MYFDGKDATHPTNTATTTPLFGLKSWLIKVQSNEFKIKIGIQIHAFCTYITIDYLFSLKSYAVP